ncbi:fimbrial protein [Klebsiella pneumoniae]|uniref:Fimbria A protein n=2 Tax=Klebsiella pneumoniae TaxID=573 RepID=A0A8D6Q3B1_KLEPN|nr:MULTISPECIES: fimbrial protein [Klebsiella]AYO66266.1 fimbria A protein [Klebsiella pneumoniae]MBM4741135.1 fimbrial protein [Klebsiella pneumoniae]MCM5920533.1 type 1 fimbrial protein [Klebsiella pneumoniae]MCP6177194.1 type 1 fimbrial protein [Klebsiella pneumoniae]MDZ0673593.1 type 1 fimbrial protein [Klebsiella pneumoniae]
MKMKKLVLVMGMGAAIFAGMANAAEHEVKDQGHGTINFTGSIIDAPCSITGDTAKQDVDLGEISNVALKNGQTSEPKTFNIVLEQCDTSDLSSVSTTFTGAADAKDKSMLGITGSANGAGIVITDGSGTPVKLGTASAAQIIGDGHNTLTFSAYLKGNGASVTAGQFSSTADFTLAYQ